MEKDEYHWKMKDKNKIMKQWRHQRRECYIRKKAGKEYCKWTWLTKERSKPIQNNWFGKELRPIKHASKQKNTKLWIQKRKKNYFRNGNKNTVEVL